MTMNILIQSKGMQELNVYFGATLNRAKDLTPALKQGGNIMLKSIDDNFRKSGRPRAWKPLALSTLRQKLSRGYSPKPLIRTGKLRRSVIFDVGNNKLRIGTNIDYGKYHQYGTGRIPRRIFLIFQDKDVDQINRLITFHITGKKFR